ncbi:branched-chain amino acid ABC transporter permease [Mesorhizobium australicum]|uniref:Amino acid/amide ABC transporter membrane protein 1, HAAT family n=1 Tax=Mesorhizobium australicum TaxID=536018 RepID=A0A1X7PT73_9HYPH|nr:branched-chain amino acid ABC transporter permease [Mesorhizobium australicum]SMH54579.1 amino acid/amide ABC transporter membrane protein 1, HAAT family [Mesorhizobium australicum]
MDINLILTQMTLGLVNGVFYAILSLGLAIIFGLLGVINFAHGVFFMLGAFIAYALGQWLGIGYWGAIVIAPLIVGMIGLVVEVTLVRHLYRLDHLYGLLLTLGLALFVEGFIRITFGPQGLPYSVPPSLRGAVNLGYMLLPTYRAWVVVAGIVLCLATWFVIEWTPLGAKLRAATDNPALVQAFGINVPVMLTLTYGAGVALAAVGGVMAAPILSVDPSMGTSIVIVVFAVVVIGGMGSIFGSIVTGLGLGLLEGLTKAVFPQASSTVIFVAMVIILVLRPRGLFGKTA